MLFAYHIATQKENRLHLVLNQNHKIIYFTDFNYKCLQK